MFTTLFLKGPVRESVPQVTAVSFYSLQGRLGWKTGLPEHEGREAGSKDQLSRG